MTERDSEMLFYAFRYCLGRMSYAVQDFCEYAKDHLQEISEKYLRLMDKEIEAAGNVAYSEAYGTRQSGLGMDCDAADWRFLQEHIREELQRRKKAPKETPVNARAKPKRPKYKYLKVLQGNYGYGWADLVEAEIKNAQEMKEFKADVAAYAENEPQYQHRVIRRRVLNEQE